MVPLFELNKSIATFLSGDPDQAKRGMLEALRALQATDDEDLDNAMFVLVINADGKSVTGHDGLTVKTALIPI